MARIDSPEVNQQLIQSQANLALAKITTQRFENLIKTDSVAQQQVDQNVQNLALQQAGVVSTTANVAQLQQQDYERVVAPFPDIITVRNTDVGDLINTGNNGAQLFRISRTDGMRIFVSVPEEFRREIVPGMHASVQLMELTGESFDGKVARTKHLIDPVTRTLLVEVDVQNPGGGQDADRRVRQCELQAPCRGATSDCALGQCAVLGSGTAGGRAAPYNDYLLPISLNYYLDAWGRVRCEAARSRPRLPACALCSTDLYRRAAESRRGSSQSRVRAGGTKA